MAKISQDRLAYWLDMVGFPEKQTKVREDAIKNLQGILDTVKSDREKTEITEAIEAIKRGWPYK